MSTAARSLFTEAIEDHLALKKQNAALESTMPLARYDVGDPLDRFPGGPARAAGADTVVVADGDAAAAIDPADGMSVGDATQIFVGPSPEQAMEAATSLEPAFGDRPFEPLNGMAPMLSLVEDIEDELAPSDHAQPSEPTPADVLRFPGGVGPRDEEPAATPAVQLEAFDAPASTPLAAPANPMQPDSFDELDAPTGEQPVLVIDTTEPFASTDGEPPVPSRGDSRKRSKPRFFGLGRKKQDEASADGWFTDGPRDFNWD